MVVAGLFKMGVSFQRWDGHLMMLCLSRDSCWLLEQKYLLYTDIVPDTPSKKNSLSITKWFSHVMKKLEASNGHSVIGVDAVCSEGC